MDDITMKVHDMATFFDLAFFPKMPKMPVDVSGWENPCFASQTQSKASESSGIHHHLFIERFDARRFELILS